MDSRLINIFCIGFAFMILFTAYQATTMIVQSVLEGLKEDTVNGTEFEGSGYTSLAIIYISWTVTTVFAPVVVSIFGPAISMFVSGITYLLYVLSFISPMVWSFYLVSILLGMGGAILWTAEGAYLALNSDDITVSRNTGVFWALFQISLLPGNLYVYLSINSEIITRSTRYLLFSVFSVVTAISLIVFALIIWRTFIERRRIKPQSLTTEQKIRLVDIVQTLKIAFQLLKTRNMLFLLIPFAYAGFSQTFFQVVYPTCIGHFIKYGDARKRLIGLHGVLGGIGEIIGGGLFGFVTKPKTSSQCALIIFIGFVVHMIFYCSVFLNFPFDAPAQETNGETYFGFNSLTSQVITFIGSFLLGLGDSSLNTQMMSLLADRYKETSASAFAIFQLTQGVVSAIIFFYASALGLQYQLLIITIVLILSTLSFYFILFNDSNIDLNTSS